MHLCHFHKGISGIIINPNLTGGRMGLTGPFHIFFMANHPNMQGILFKQKNTKLAPPQTLGHYSQMPQL